MGFDARNFVLCLQYWTAGNSENLENMLLNLAFNYVPALKGVEFNIPEPAEYPDTGIWHPLAPNFYESISDYLEWYDNRKDIQLTKKSNVIGIILQRSHIITGDAGHYEGVVSEFEAAGCHVIPVFAGGLDFSSPVNKFFYDPYGTGLSFVDVVVSLTGFALVGGPARQDSAKGIQALKELDVPYLVSLPLVFQTTEEWF